MTTIKEIINVLNLNDGWIIDAFDEWHSDDCNDFRFEKKQKRIIYKKDIREIAKILKEECNKDWGGNIEEFEIAFDNSIANGNDYWDMFQTYIS